MRKSKQTSRRRRALRWLALLACMIAWMVVPGRFRFLPGQAIREAERLGKMGSTQLIAELPGYEGRTLRGNSKGLMISLLTESIVERGWDLEYRVYLDCSVPQPFYAGISSYHFPGEEGSNWLDSLTDWFGRIDDPAAAAVRLEIYVDDELTSTFTLGKEDWIEKDGFTYFVLEFDEPRAQFVRFQSLLLDGQGNVLASHEVEGDTFGMRSPFREIHQ